MATTVLNDNNSVSSSVVSSGKKVKIDPSEVFETGKFEVILIKETIELISSSKKVLFIFTPTEPGSYPVILFFPGFSCDISFYSHFLQLIASHGYVIAAPQLYVLPTTSVMREIETASEVISWLPEGLGYLLPEKVKGDLSKLTVMGHSRGGKTAFSLALGYGKPSLPFSAVIGIDPVAGNSVSVPEPRILTNVPQSFDISAPITVIGTGLGPVKKFGIGCACAPAGYNHVEFFRESRPTCAHFVAVDYGHMDMLNDHPPGFVGTMTSAMCKKGIGPRQLMRKCCSGIVVASLKAYLHHDKSYLNAISADPSIAPVKLHPVQIIYKTNP